MHFEMIGKYGLCEIHRKSFKFPGNPNIKAQMSNQAQNQKYKYPLSFSHSDFDLKFGFWILKFIQLAIDKYSQKYRIH